MKTVFLRALESDDKAAALLGAIREPEATRGRQRFELDAARFASVPGSPFAYWMSERLRELFTDLPSFASSERTAVVGLKTSEDSRFVRLHWEVPHACEGSERRWITFAKGGEFSSFYVSIPTVVDWLENGAQSWAFYEANQSRTGGMIKNPDYYFRPGITWLLRAHKFAPQALPANCIFSLRSYCAFTPSQDLLLTLAVFNSAAFDYVFKTTLGRFGYPEFIVGALLRLPWVEPTGSMRERLEGLAHRAWSARRSLDTCIETSRAFTLPALLQVAGGTLEMRTAAWAERVRSVEADVAAVQTEINECCFSLYGIDDADRRVITEGFGGGAVEFDESSDTDAETGLEVDDEHHAQASADAASVAADLLSWAAGVAFGRFDVRLAIGAGSPALEPHPFDPLPGCSPATLTGSNGLPLTAMPGDYPINFPANGILVDDFGHARDLAAALRAVFDEVFGARADVWWDEAAALLSQKGHDIRAWLATDFFARHLKRHSKSRRKAPILWQLGTPSGRYSIWLYAHRLTRDSFFQIQNDVLTPKLAHEERQLTSLVQSAGVNPSAKDRKEIAAQESLVDELRALLEEMKRVAPLWNPVLDDGVALTMAPLWQLVPQHKSWQRELKSKWHELAAGKYDWAHLAMHLWPERVVPKCASDRSVAIAHGLEDVFWAEGDDGKWKPRPTPTRSVDELVRERTSVAVKVALKELTETSAHNDSKARTRRASS